MVRNDITYHIVGGGLAGLSCAYFLKEKHKNIKVVVYEASPYLGGRSYSQFDEKFDTQLDNAMHLILGSDKFMSRFVKDDEWSYQTCYYNINDGNAEFTVSKNKELLMQTILGDGYKDIALPIRKKSILNSFPFTKNKCRFWFSNQNFSQRVVNLLSAYADEVHLNYKLQKILSQFGIAAQLQFTKDTVDIGANDKVILALDNASCSKLVDVQKLEHDQIINIIYHTSQTIFLPKGVSFMRIEGGLADAISVKDNILTAIINKSVSDKENLANLAAKVWSDLDKIRGVNSAFIPPYKAILCKHAIIRHDAKNNDNRPDDALTNYPNVFIAGDWTMKNHLCCMETAVKSADRAIKTALKSAL